MTNARPGHAEHGHEYDFGDWLARTKRHAVVVHERNEYRVARWNREASRGMMMIKSSVNGESQMKYFVVIPCVVLVVTAVAKAQHCWCPQSASPGATAIVGQTEDELVSGPPWDVGGADVRSAWLTHGAAQG